MQPLTLKWTGLRANGLRVTPTGWRLDVALRNSLRARRSLRSQNNNYIVSIHHPIVVVFAHNHTQLTRATFWSLVRNISFCINVLGKKRRQRGKRLRQWVGATWSVSHTARLLSKHFIVTHRWKLQLSYHSFVTTSYLPQTTVRCTNNAYK